jgi:hypothetical protein
VQDQGFEARTRENFPLTSLGLLAFDLARSYTYSTNWCVNRDYCLHVTIPCRFIGGYRRFGRICYRKLLAIRLRQKVLIMLFNISLYLNTYIHMHMQIQVLTLVLVCIVFECRCFRFCSAWVEALRWTSSTSEALHRASNRLIKWKHLHCELIFIKGKLNDQKGRKEEKAIEGRIKE